MRFITPTRFSKPCRCLIIWNTYKVKKRTCRIIFQTLFYYLVCTTFDNYQQPFFRLRAMELCGRLPFHSVQIFRHISHKFPFDAQMLLVFVFPKKHECLNVFLFDLRQSNKFLFSRQSTSAKRKCYLNYLNYLKTTTVLPSFIPITFV